VGNEVKYRRQAEGHVRKVLERLGEDVGREGLLETPKRYVKFMEEFLSYPEFEYTTFDAEGASEMIVQTNIPFFSLCEHHMAPFFGTAAVAYIPNGRIVGLSKLARCVQKFAHNLQNQERITNQVVDELQAVLSPKGVACVISARHLCMEMRGVKTHDTMTTTSALRGLFMDDHMARNEFYSIIKLQGQ